LNLYKGKNFCRSAAKAFKIITQNVLRVVVTDKIANVILFLSNVAITTLIGVFSFYFFTKKIPLDSIKTLSPELNYYLVPLVITIVGTYIVTKICFDVFALGIDSLLICVLIDLDKNDGSPQRPYFMSKDLRDLLGKRKKYND
jgi:choline transporter-like protein 2/4/5